MKVWLELIERWAPHRPDVTSFAEPEQRIRPSHRLERPQQLIRVDQIPHRRTVSGDTHLGQHNWQNNSADN